jgi:hypothetical protein
MSKKAGMGKKRAFVRPPLRAPASGTPGRARTKPSVRILEDHCNRAALAYY